jgi:hypothetical protein
MLVTRVIVQLPPQLTEPVEHACRDGRLRPRPVAVELLDDQRRDEQFQLALEPQDTQGHDPLLAPRRVAMSSHTDVSISRAQHEPECYAAQLGKPVNQPRHAGLLSTCRFLAVCTLPPICTPAAHFGAGAWSLQIMLFCRSGLRCGRRVVGNGETADPAWLAAGWHLVAGFAPGGWPCKVAWPAPSPARKLSASRTIPAAILAWASALPRAARPAGRRAAAPPAWRRPGQRMTVRIPVWPSGDRPGPCPNPVGIRARGRYRAGRVTRSARRRPGGRPASGPAARPRRLRSGRRRGRSR